MPKPLWLLLGLLTLALAACSAAPSVQEITLEATDIHFDHTSFEVQANQPVRLTYVNNGVLEHDFTIVAIPVKEVDEHADEGDHAMTTEPDLHVAPKPGTTGTLEFTPTTPGTYEFFCTVAGHREGGMVGTLVVK